MLWTPCVGVNRGQYGEQCSVAMCANASGGCCWSSEGNHSQTYDSQLRCTEEINRHDLLH